jgi:hypothetical protein
MSELEYHIYHEIIAEFAELYNILCDIVLYLGKFFSDAEEKSF